MPLLHQLVTQHAHATPDAIALIYKDKQYSYGELQSEITRLATLLDTLGLHPGERIGIYLPKIPETVFAFFAASQIAAIFVPINPLLKPKQVTYILDNCDVRLLITSPDRLAALQPELVHCPNLESALLTHQDSAVIHPISQPGQIHEWDAPLKESPSQPAAAGSTDTAAILYTSGSTGLPKGVMLSQQNLIIGAQSVAQYLEYSPNDRLLAVLPFSFDYGLNQLTSAFYAGASVTLMDYLLPRDVITAITKYGITGLAGVPPLWNQLAPLDWSKVTTLRYMTNSGGTLPASTLNSLRTNVPRAKFFLMYGLTEAFRSTYLPPEKLDERPGSIGKAIPFAEIHVVDHQGNPCLPGETGQLIHCGPLVAQGYWNDSQKTAERFKPFPTGSHNIAVWSGDSVKIDEEGYLYFVGRDDEMIKTSGYRVSPTEIEEIYYESKLVNEAVAIGVFHPTLGQGIVLIAELRDPQTTHDQLVLLGKKNLPNFMQPIHIAIKAQLPRTPNGKIDRKALYQEYSVQFTEQG